MPTDLPALGFALPVSGSWATPDRMASIARRAERRGYDALWTFQRLLQPLPAPDGSRGAVAHDPAARRADDPAYRSVHDPLLPLAYVAAHTERIGLGTATICAPFVQPVVLAKAMVTADHLTGGRLSVGLGIGWSPQEYAAAGVPFERRGPRMEEYLRCLRALWTEDPVEFAGEFYTVPRSYVGPAPLQRPHPPLLLGGAAPAALRRAGRLAHGWIGSSRQDPRTIADAVAHVREGAREAGRDPEALRILLRVVVDVTEADPGPGRAPYAGTPEQVLDDLAGLASAGVTEAFVDLNFAARVGSPDVDPEAATSYAEWVLDALAPG